MSREPFAPLGGNVKGAWAKCVLGWTPAWGGAGFDFDDTDTEIKQLLGVLGLNSP